MVQLRALLAAALSAVCFLLLGAPAAAEPIDVTIVQVNDLPRADDVAGRGGLAKLATIVKQERQGGRQVLVVHAGNAISPSLLSGFDQGAFMIPILNRLGVSVMAFGNHEFDFGADVAGERARAADFPVVLANVKTIDGTEVDGTVPTWVYDAGGVRIAFIGLARADLAEVSRPGPVKVEPVLPLITRMAPALRQAGADLVVGLGALTAGEERALIDSGLVDIVLGSSEHMHASYDGRTAAAASSRNAEHVMLLDLRLERYVVETFADMEVPSIGDDAPPLDAAMQRLESRFRWSVNFRTIDSADVPGDPEIADEVQSQLLKLSRDLSNVIGTVDADLDIRDVVVRNGQSPFANTIADAMRTALNADAALVNAGSIRADEIVPAGTPVTRRSIVQWLPFENRVLLLKVNGEQLLSALENGVSEYEEHAGRFPAISGLDVTFDLSRPVGDRIVQALVDGKPLSLDRTYALAVNEFIAGGGDGYTMLMRAPRLVGLQTSELLVNHVVDYLSATGHVAANPERRIRPVSP